MVLRDRNNSPAICGNDRCVDSSGSRRSSAAVSADAPGAPEPRSSASRARSAWGWPAPEQLIDLPHERPGPGQVAEREMDADELDPGLNGEVGQGIGQQRPQP